MQYVIQEEIDMTLKSKAKKNTIKQQNWVFYNHHTEKRIESGDLGYLLLTIQRRFGYQVPETFKLDLIVKGYVRLYAVTHEGETHLISIGEAEGVGMTFEDRLIENNFAIDVASVLPQEDKQEVSHKPSIGSMMASGGIPYDKIADIFLSASKKEPLAYQQD